MPSTFDEIKQQARELPAEDRAELAELLLESLQEPPLPEIQAAWDEEIRKRIAAYERGEMAAVDAEDVFAQARHLTR